MLDFEIAELTRLIQTEPNDGVCGDATLLLETPDTIFVALFDGAGHGKPAHQVACGAIEYLRANHNRELPELLLSLHRYLHGTRGGVAGLCRIDRETGTAEYAGIGNMMARLLFPTPQRLNNRGGILGYEIVNPKLESFTLVVGSVLILYSDGVSDHFEPVEAVNFEAQTAEQMAHTLIRHFSKPHDDASVIVIKGVGRD